MNPIQPQLQRQKGRMHNRIEIETALFFWMRAAKLAHASTSDRCFSLVHKSRLSDDFVENPADFVKVVSVWSSVWLSCGMHVWVGVCL